MTAFVSGARFGPYRQRRYALAVPDGIHPRRWNRREHGNAFVDFHDAVLEAVYPVARPTVSESLEDWMRRHHQDLADMSDETLRSEKRRLTMRLDLDHPILYDDWLAGRAAAIDAEIARRARAVARPLGVR